MDTRDSDIYAYAIYLIEEFNSLTDVEIQLKWIFDVARKSKKERGQICNLTEFIQLCIKGIVIDASGNEISLGMEGFAFLCVVNGTDFFEKSSAFYYFTPAEIVQAIIKSLPYIRNIPTSYDRAMEIDSGDQPTHKERSATILAVQKVWSYLDYGKPTSAKRKRKPISEAEIVSIANSLFWNLCYWSYGYKTRLTTDSTIEAEEKTFNLTNFTPTHRTVENIKKKTIILSDDSDDDDEKKHTNTTQMARRGPQPPRLRLPPPGTIKPVPIPVDSDEEDEEQPDTPSTVAPEEDMDTDTDASIPVTPQMETDTQMVDVLPGGDNVLEEWDAISLITIDKITKAMFDPDRAFDNKTQEHLYLLGSYQILRLILDWSSVLLPIPTDDAEYERQEIPANQEAYDPSLYSNLDAIHEKRNKQRIRVMRKLRKLMRISFANKRFRDRKRRDDDDDDDKKDDDDDDPKPDDDNRKRQKRTHRLSLDELPADSLGVLFPYLTQSNVVRTQMTSHKLHQVLKHIQNQTHRPEIVSLVLRAIDGSSVEVNTVPAPTSKHIRPLPSITRMVTEEEFDKDYKLSVSSANEEFGNDGNDEFEELYQAYYKYNVRVDRITTAEDKEPDNNVLRYTNGQTFVPGDNHMLRRVWKADIRVDENGQVSGLLFQLNLLPNLQQLTFHPSKNFFLDDNVDGKFQSGNPFRLLPPSVWYLRIPMVDIQRLRMFHLPTTIRYLEIESRVDSRHRFKPQLGYTYQGLIPDDLRVLYVPYSDIGKWRPDTGIGKIIDIIVNGDGIFCNDLRSRIFAQISFETSYPYSGFFMLHNRQVSDHSNREIVLTACGSMLASVHHSLDLLVDLSTMNEDYVLDVDADTDINHSMFRPLLVSANRQLRHLYVDIVDSTHVRRLGFEMDEHDEFVLGNESPSDIYYPKWLRKVLRLWFTMVKIGCFPSIETIVFVVPYDKPGNSCKKHITYPDIHTSQVKECEISVIFMDEMDHVKNNSRVLRKAYKHLFDLEAEIERVLNQ